MSRLKKSRWYHVAGVSLLILLMIPVLWYITARMSGVLVFRNEESAIIIQDTLTRFFDGSESSPGSAFSGIISQYVLNRKAGLITKQVLLVIGMLVSVLLVSKISRKHKGKWKGYAADANRRAKTAKAAVRRFSGRMRQLMQGLLVLVKLAPYQTYSVEVYAEDADNKDRFDVVRGFAAGENKAPMIPLFRTAMFDSDGTLVDRSISARLYFTDDEVYLISRTKPFFVRADDQFTKRYALPDGETVIEFADCTTYRFRVEYDHEN